MTSREWVRRFITARLERVREEPHLPIPPFAQEMTDVMFERWLSGEAAFWLHASQKAGLTPGQRTMRMQVSRFYENRLVALRSTDPSRVRDGSDEREEGSDGPDRAPAPDA